MVNGNARPSRLSPWFAVAFYGVLGLLGLIWSAALDGEETLGASHGGVDLSVALLLGLGIALPSVAVGKWLERVSPSLRALSEELREAFGDMTHVEVAMFALASAVGEEIFFRGAMLPAFGLIVSSAIFGFAHGFFQPRYRVWGLFAVAIGLVFGAVTLWTGTIVAATVAHATINYVGLLELVPEPRRPSGPGEGAGGKES